MDIDDWDICADPHAMCEWLFPMHGTASNLGQPRELRLYLCGCARAVWATLPDAIRVTVEIAEAFADAPLELWADVKPVAELADAKMHFDGHPDDLADWTAELNRLGYPAAMPERLTKHSAEAWKEYAWLAAIPFWERVPNLRMIKSARHRCDLLRDIYDHPVRRPAWDANWVGPDAITLATAMDRMRNYAAMPLLADALADRGCTDARVLDHCRSARRHGRGCWVVENCLEAGEDDRSKRAIAAFRDLSFAGVFHRAT
jgi:hypothetical protein